MADAWESRYGKFEVEMAPREPGFVLVQFVVAQKDATVEAMYPQYRDRATERLARVYYFRDDTETWASALSELLKEDPNRSDIWAFSAGAPASPRLVLEK
jgi:hypothetical protein